MSDPKYTINGKTFETEDEYLSYMMTMDCKEYFKLKKGKGKVISVGLKEFMRTTSQ